MKNKFELKNKDSVNIIYHGKDFDGIGSASVVVDQLKRQGFNGKFNLFPMDPGDEFKYQPKKDDNLFIVDLSFDMEKMNELAKTTNLNWIDHHKTALDAYNSYDKKAEFDKNANFVKVAVENCACKHTWNAFTDNKKSRLIECINDVDMFNRDNKEAFHLDYALNSYKGYQDPTSKDWENLFAQKDDKLLDNLIEKGKTIQSYIYTTNKKKCARNAFEVKIEDYKGIAINVRDYGSQVFDPVENASDYDFFLTYRVGYKDGEQYYDFGMYKDNAKNDFSCGDFCKKNFGGGGHIGAAGFRHHEFPVDLIKPVKQSENNASKKEKLQSKPAKPKGKSVNIIYHGGDFDGIGSAATILHKLKLENYQGDVNLHPIDRGQEIDYTPAKGDEIYIVDYALDMDVMHDFAKKGDLTWIDHHKTSLDELNAYEHKNEFLKDLKHISLEMDSCACKQTWNYLHDNKKSNFIELLNDYDMFNPENQDAFSLDYAMKADESYNNPKNPKWDKLFRESKDNTKPSKTIEDLIDKGIALRSYLDVQNLKNCEKAAFEVELEGGYKGLALNNSGQGSKVFNKVKDKEKYDFVMTFGNNLKGGKDFFNFGIYSCGNETTDFNCADFASKNFGGGGHKGAAGFRCDHFPVEIIKPVVKKDKENKAEKAKVANIALLLKKGQAR